MLPLNKVIQGECIQTLETLPADSVDMIFADPPYHLQLEQDLWRPDQSLVDGVTDYWDRFSNDEEYSAFTQAWLSACKRVLKNTGTIWVIGTYHNIYRVGSMMQELGFWFLNDIVWIKTNPMPNFRGVRFTNAHETLLWASKSKGSRYTFNHHAMKSLNGDIQMRSDWVLPICTGPERIKVDGKKAHPTQKPESLMYRIILSSTNPGDIVLDPFFGTGTTGAVAKKLGRQWIGIERDSKYVYLSEKRIEKIGPMDLNGLVHDRNDLKRLEPRVSFGSLIENGYLRPGEALYFHGDTSKPARIKLNGKLDIDGYEGSIHQCARFLLGNSPANGWEQWFYMNKAGAIAPIDELRHEMRKDMLADTGDY